MARKRLVLFILCFSVIPFLSSCNPFQNNCPPNVQIDYIDALKWNDIHYESHPELKDTIANAQLGKLIGYISYRMAEDACLNYKMKNGDATFLEEGTKVYSLSGYRTSSRVYADGRIFQANEKPKAKTIGDLYDIKGKVENIAFESTDDSRPLHSFSQQSIEPFLHAYLQLPLLSSRQTSRAIDTLKDEDRVFIRLLLKDGSSLRISYWMDQNITTPWAEGNEATQKLVKKEWKKGLD
ncbi:hypothetical protein [Bacillus sp. 1P06AnD]|uniref:hypothetical protein n=1 Tax=Bacillus sp. 1P06AnD TaxID=3132208 RepID=UPI0039A288A1